MSYKFQHQKLFIYRFSIIAVLVTFSACEIQNELNSITRFFNMPSGLMQQYCNTVCGPPKFAFAAILKAFCQLKCPNSTLANIPSGSNKTTVPDTMSTSIATTRLTITTPSPTATPSATTTPSTVTTPSTINTQSTTTKPIRTTLSVTTKTVPTVTATQSVNTETPPVLTNTTIPEINVNMTMKP